MKNKKLINSFKYAFTGMWSAYKSERNMKIHIAVAILVILFGVFLQISTYEWLACTVCFAMVIGSEIAVGSLENFADHFFDGLIFDWVVQSDIGKTLDTVKNTKNQLDKAMSKLYEEKVTEEFMIKQIEDKYIIFY